MNLAVPPVSLGEMAVDLPQLPRKEDRALQGIVVHVESYPRPLQLLRFHKSSVEGSKLPLPLGKSCHLLPQLLKELCPFKGGGHHGRYRLHHLEILRA